LRRRSLVAVIGGLHLTTPAFEATIWPTVEALVELALQVVVPAHCTGWRATHALAVALPDAFVPGSVGTRYILQWRGILKQSGSEAGMTSSEGSG
jgi:7,8-dihydropterin-6-yl-methyl-4-(beta-D-ribofuranosyl)aminobenzene 5'-phosphate synthase